MSTELKDYLHLYLGCQVQYIEKLVFGNNENRRALFIGIEGDYIRLSAITINNKIGNNFSRRISDVKLILRPLSDMTEEERVILFTINCGDCVYEFEAERINLLHQMGI